MSVLEKIFETVDLYVGDADLESVLGLLKLRPRSQLLCAAVSALSYLGVERGLDLWAPYLTEEEQLELMLEARLMSL